LIIKVWGIITTEIKISGPHRADVHLPIFWLKFVRKWGRLGGDGSFPPRGHGPIGVKSQARALKEPLLESIQFHREETAPCWGRILIDEQISSIGRE
jgi:hypothetical protein